MDKINAHHQAFYEEVGRLIRDARQRCTPPITQEGLAKMVGLSRTSITNVEKGRQKCLLHTLADIATALQTDAADLIPRSSAKASDLDAALSQRPSEERYCIRSTIAANQIETHDHGA